MINSTVFKMKKEGVKEWDDHFKMKRLIILKIKFEVKKVVLKEGQMKEKLARRRSSITRRVR